MNLYERSVTLRVALDTASEAAGDHELLERGRQVIALLDTSTRNLADLETLRQALEFGPLTLEISTLSQSARQLRTGLTKHQAKALQHASTANFEQAVRNSINMATRWAKTLWRESFAPWVGPIDRATTGLLPGDPRHHRQATLIAQKLKALRECHPLDDRDRIVKLLEGADVRDWPAAIQSLGEDLMSQIQRLEGEHLALSSEVREVLDRAATSDGFPLNEMSPELLENLRLAGVLGSLVVRRS